MNIVDAYCYVALVLICIAGFKQSGINCETNAAISTVLRAMQEASDLQQWFN